MREILVIRCSEVKQGRISVGSYPNMMLPKGRVVNLRIWLCGSVFTHLQNRVGNKNSCKEREIGKRHLCIPFGSGEDCLHADTNCYGSF